MSKYVKAAECAEIISKKYNIPLYDLVDIFAEIPAADVAPTAHGEWIQQPRPYEDEIVCSVCGAQFNIIDNCTEQFDYCCKCGAIMDM